MSRFSPVLAGFAAFAAVYAFERAGSPQAEATLPSIEQVEAAIAFAERQANGSAGAQD